MRRVLAAAPAGRTAISPSSATRSSTALSFQKIDAPVDHVVPIPPAHAPPRRVRGAPRRARHRHRLPRPAQPPHRRRSRDCAVMTPGTRRAAPEARAHRRHRRAAEGCADHHRDRNADRLRRRAHRRAEGLLRRCTRCALVQAAGEIGLARLSINGDVAMERTPPMLRAGARRRDAAAGRLPAGVRPNPKRRCWRS